MSHQSDYSFVQRAVANGWFYIWFVVYAFRYDRFMALNLRRIMRFELRSIVTLLLLIAIPLHLSYDIGLTTIKYYEGFIVDPDNNETVSKPSYLWSQPHQDLASVLDYTLACAMAIFASIFFLLQSFYHYISKSVTKSSFMSSLEFRINIICSVMLIAVFPLIQYLARNGHNKREAAPQLAFSLVTCCIGALGIRSNSRFKTLLKVALMTMTENSQDVAEKLEHFKDMNMILTISMFGTGIPLVIASVDGLTPNPVIATNKFASDFLVMNVNFFEFIIWVTVVLIFYPRRTVVGSAFGVSSGGGTLSRTVPSSARQNNNNNTFNNNNINTSQNQGDSAKTINGDSCNNNPYNNNGGYASPGRSYSTSKERPPSIVPYKAPNDTRNFGDTMPLTRIREVDTTEAVQMEAFKSMYDMNAPSNAPMSVTSPTSPTKLRYEGPASLTLSPDQSRISSPSFGSGTLRSPKQPTARVGQQTFVLEVDTDPNQSQERQWGQDDYNRIRSPTTPTTPTRPPKGYRGPPSY
ncbi:hypothetical protein BGX21_005025 [Mortierella sp. AD011]|nr:hypothetical protein BGX20_009170 [Mortierella sp. AD010]KAF9400078.1 hypothetical protein BGX21_005025 [Mortierella sp. AD011]